MVPAVICSRAQELLQWPVLFFDAADAGSGVAVQAVGMILWSGTDQWALGRRRGASSGLPAVDGKTARLGGGGCRQPEPANYDEQQHSGKARSVGWI